MNGLDFLLNQDQRKLVILLWGLLLIFSAGSVSYISMPQYRGYAETNNELIKTRYLVDSEVDIDSLMKQVQSDIEKLEYQLNGDVTSLPVKQLESYIIGKLHETSLKKGLTLQAIQPTLGSLVGDFQEYQFQLKLTGQYLDLYLWIAQLSEEMGFLVIQSITLSPEKILNGKAELFVTMDITAYKVVDYGTG